MSIQPAQVTIFDVMGQQAHEAFAATKTKTYAELVAGDYVELRRHDGKEIGGWCATRHPITGTWECLAAREWEPGFRRHTFPLWPNENWRFVRATPDWSLEPTPDVVVAWMQSVAPTLSVDRFTRLNHTALDAWPIGAPDAWRHAISEAYTALAIQHLSLRDHLRDARKTSNAGKRIWSCPPRVQKQITQDIWPLPGEQRLPALQALRWTRGEHFGMHTRYPEGLRAFNLTAVDIYEDYYRWAFAHVVSPRQLLELCDAWGSNLAPEERARLAQNEGGMIRGKTE